MYTPLTPKLAHKDKAVYLIKDQPVGRSFGDRHTIPSASSAYPTKGYIMNMGFVAGRLRVFSPRHEGDKHTEFNELGAAEHLQYDPFF